MARKTTFIVKCTACGKPETIHDYSGRWKGDYRCPECFEEWYKAQPPIELRLYDMLTGKYIETLSIDRR